MVVAPLRRFDSFGVSLGALGKQEGTNRTGIIRQIDRDDVAVKRRDGYIIVQQPVKLITDFREKLLLVHDPATEDNLLWGNGQGQVDTCLGEVVSL